LLELAAAPMSETVIGELAEWISERMAPRPATNSS